MPAIRTHNQLGTQTIGHGNPELVRRNRIILRYDHGRATDLWPYLAIVNTALHKFIQSGIVWQWLIKRPHQKQAHILDVMTSQPAHCRYAAQTMRYQRNPIFGLDLIINCLIPCCLLWGKRIR